MQGQEHVHATYYTVQHREWNSRLAALDSTEDTFLECHFSSCSEKLEIDYRLHAYL